MRDWNEIEEDREKLLDLIVNQLPILIAAGGDFDRGKVFEALWMHFRMGRDQIKELQEELKKLNGEKNV